MPVPSWRRLRRPALAAVAFALSLTGCGIGTRATPPLADSAQCAPFKQYQGHAGTTVSMIGAGGSQRLEAVRLRQAWRTFSDCTGIKIGYVASGSFEKEIQKGVAIGQTPDLAAFPQPGLLAMFATAGRLRPLPEPTRSRVEQNWPADWQKYAGVNGVLYGVPLGAGVKSFVWYSPSYFTQHGYQVPQTWDEMIALSDKIAASGVKPWCEGIGSGTATGWPATDWMEEVMLKLHGPEIYDQWVNHQIPFNDPKVLAVANKVGTILRNPGYINGGVQSIATTNYDVAGLPILTNKCAMFKQASFYANQWPPGAKVSADGDVYAFEFPPIDPGKRKATEASGDFVAAFSNRPEVQAFHAYLASADFVGRRVALGRFVSARQDIDLALYSSPIDKLAAQILLAPNAVLRFDGSDLMPAVVGTATFWTGMTDWINGKDTKATLDDIEASWPK